MSQYKPGDQIGGEYKLLVSLASWAGRLSLADELFAPPHPRFNQRDLAAPVDNDVHRALPKGRGLCIQHRQSAAMQFLPFSGRISWLVQIDKKDGNVVPTGNRIFQDASLGLPWLASRGAETENNGFAQKWSEVEQRPVQSPQIDSGEIPAN